jgi:hypothetical protein
MGLALSVGFMQEVRENDPEAYDDFHEYFRQLNTALERERLPAHREPDEIAPEHRISLGMFGYSGLHYLRRIAAHKHFTGVLPPPGNDKASDDALLQKYYRDANVAWEEGFNLLYRKLQRLIRNRAFQAPSRGFDHLIDHSDCESLYTDCF